MDHQSHASKSLIFAAKGGLQDRGMLATGLQQLFPELHVAIHTLTGILEGQGQKKLTDQQASLESQAP